MERFIIFIIGAILTSIGIYFIIFNIPIEGDSVSEYGLWHHDKIGGSPLIFIGVLIVYTAFIMKPDKKKKE